MSTDNAVDAVVFGVIRKLKPRGLEDITLSEALMIAVQEAIDYVCDNPDEFDLYTEDQAAEYAANHPPERDS
jgi:hypothetical protein